MKIANGCTLSMDAKWSKIPYSDCTSETALLYILRNILNPISLCIRASYSGNVLVATVFEYSIKA